MLILLLKTLARLPLVVLQGLGAVAGVVLYLLPGRYRQRLQANAGQAGYHQPGFGLRAAAHAGMQALETAWAWFRPHDAVARVQIPQRELLDTIYGQQRPILFLTPHIGNFELAARVAARHAPFHVLYRPPRRPALRRVVETCRDRDGVRIAPANRHGLKQMLQALKQGEQVGILPDQVPAEREGAWADLFGRPAYTVTLPGRLAQDPQVLVVATSCTRLPWGRGWVLYLEPITDRPDATPEAQAAWVNQIMMRLIRRCPEQYLWSYHRYKNP